MTTTPKPKYCGQDWLDMTPTDGGRICGQCSKTIVDFSKMTWADIERIQHQNNNSVCGMYAPKQLDNWGREVPTSSCSKFAATTALLVSMTVSSQSFSQKTATADTIQKTIVHGTITGKTKEGRVDTLGFTSIVLKGTPYGVMADEQGNYQLDLTNFIDTIQNPTLVFSMVGFDRLELKLKNENKGDLRYDPQLNQDNVNIIAFYVTKPTLGQRVKWKFRKWFGRKDK